MNEFEYSEYCQSIMISISASLSMGGGLGGWWKRGMLEPQFWGQAAVGAVGVE